MKKIKTFIFVHDQNIVKDFIKVNKFDNLKDLTYVFVGNNDSSDIENLPNVIVCNKLPHNIEQYPKLTSYTGWYAIFKNNLYEDCDFLNLFEYDINLSDDFSDVLENNLENEILGYIQLNVRNVAFLHHRYAGALIESIKKNYEIDVVNFIKSIPENTFFSVTSNHTFSKKMFEKYMEWVEPLISDIKELNMAGHQVERSIGLFYLLNNLDYKLLNGVLKHFQFDSHKTQNMPQDKFKNHYNELLK